MIYKLTPYVIAQLLTSVVSIVAAIFLWKRRASRGGWPLLLLFVMVAEWALANGLEAAAVAGDLKILWSKVAYIGAQTSPVLLVLFALQYTGRGKGITPLKTIALFLIPVVTIILAATNELHRLIWTGFTSGPEGTNSLIYQHGLAFWISISFVFTMVITGTALLIRYAVHSQMVYRKQSWFVLVASILPLIGSLMYILNLNPFPGLDTISVSFLFTGLIMVWGMYKERLLDIVPIAHELVLENINDGILVIDDLYRIIDLNSAVEKILAIKRNEIVGAQAETLGEFWVGIQDQFKKDQIRRIESTAEKFNNVILDVRISPLNDQRGRFLGWAVILDDISSRKKVEADLNRVNNRLKRQLVEIQELQEQLHDQAMRDSLTGVYNRRYLEETLSREIAKSKRDNAPLSIIMIDVDYFKRINDAFGHKAGDDVVIALGRLLQTQTRDGDCVSRYGGDEFVLIMPEMSQKDALIRAELWRDAIKAMIFQIGEEVVNVTISLGISTFPENGSESEELLKSADDALYHAKESGRDRTCLG